MVAQKPPVRATREDDGVMLLSPMRDVLKIMGKLSRIILTIIIFLVLYYFLSTLAWIAMGLSFSDEETLFATRHEIRHFLEKKQLLAEEGGERKFENHLKGAK